MNLTELIPATEVKLMLSRRGALHKQFALSNRLIKLFDISAGTKERPVWYLDTPAQQLKKWGWSVRFRQQKDDLELTCKKRYTEAGYKAMRQTALAGAFDREFSPEIDLGFSKKTISLSYVRSFKAEDGQPGLLESKRLALTNAPSILLNWLGENKGFGTLCGAVLFGPVRAVNYEGRFNNLKIKIEVWKLKGYLAELSFDTETAKSAEEKKQVVRLLRSNNLLEPVDTLKTDALFDAYAQDKAH